MKKRKDGTFIGEVVDESTRASEELAGKALDKLSAAQLAKMVILGDPLKRLQAMEVALLVNFALLLVALGISAWRGWGAGWLFVAAFLFVNAFPLVYKYVQWRKEYVAAGGEL